jgi:uncharacterized integral membrane protein
MTRSDLVTPAGRAIPANQPSATPSSRVKTILDAMSDALGAWPSHRDPRLRQLQRQPAPAAHGPQPAHPARRVPIPEKTGAPTSSRGKALREAVEAKGQSPQAARLMSLVTWALRLFLFFTLFAFALNNSQDVVVHWFFGYQWRTPLVIVGAHHLRARRGLRCGGHGAGLVAPAPPRSPRPRRPAAPSPVEPGARWALT